MTAAPPVMTERPRFGAVLAIGLVAGFVSGLFGVGGGILIVPALVMVVHMDRRLAHGTSLAAVLPIAIANLLTYWAHGNVDWWAAVWLSVGSVIGAILGTRLLHVLPHRVLGFGFAAVLVITAVRLFISTEADGRAALDTGMVLAMVLLGMVAGMLAGLLGIGGGVVIVPALVVLFGELPALAKGTAVAVIIPTSITGTWRNWRKHNVDLQIAMTIGVCGVVAGVAGSTLSDRLSPTTSNVLFAILLLLVAARLVWDLERERRREPAISEGDV